MPVLALDYRLAPEYQSPHGIEDALDALAWMAENGPAGPSPARKIFVCGDSAGGGMILSLLLAARDGLPGRSEAAPPTPPINGAVSICPLTDMTYDFRRSKHNSYTSRIYDSHSRTGDPIFTDSHGDLLADMKDRRAAAKAYGGELGLSHQLVSPLWADSFAGLPPIMLLAADEDLTVDDSVDIANRARADGVAVDLCVWPGVWHCWVMCTEGRDMYGNKGKPMKEACVAMRHIGIYLKALAART